jgi:hypothetical protein
MPQLSEQYVNPFVSLAIDDEHRMLLAAIAGTSDEPQPVIHRYSADLMQRESFAIPKLQPINPSLGGLQGFQWGIRAGHNGDVYFWTPNQIGRIALPEASGSALTSTASTPLPHI